LHKYLSLLVHGPSKHGKTFLASTAPKPMIVLDVDDGWRHIPIRMKAWNPHTDPEPVYDQANPEWDALVIDVREWNTVLLTYEHIIKGTIPYRSMAIDSVTEIQTKCKDHVIQTADAKQPLSVPRIQDWGTLLDQMVQHFKLYRYLAKDHPTIQTVVFVAETNQHNGKWAPTAQGKLQERMPYLVDVIGYLWAESEGENGNTRTIRKMLLGPHGQFVTGKRGNLPDLLVDPTVPMMLEYINAEEVHSV
jgi:AAA domain